MAWEGKRTPDSFIDKLKKKKKLSPCHNQEGVPETAGFQFGHDSPCLYWIEYCNFFYLEQKLVFTILPPQQHRLVEPGDLVCYDLTSLFIERGYLMLCNVV